MIRLTLKRHDKRWSKNELARRVGMHPSTICRVEAGREIPSGNQLARIAMALDVPESEAQTLLLPLGSTLDESDQVGKGHSSMPKDLPNKVAVMLRLSPDELRRLDVLAEQLAPRMPMAEIFQQRWG